MTPQPRHLRAVSREIRPPALSAVAMLASVIISNLLHHALDGGVEGAGDCRDPLVGKLSEQ